MAELPGARLAHFADESLGIEFQATDMGHAVGLVVSVRGHVTSCGLEPGEVAELVTALSGWLASRDEAPPPVSRIETSDG